MSSEIQVIHATSRYETRSFVFPGGELQVQIPGLPDRLSGDVTVLVRLQSSDALVRLLLATEILHRQHRGKKKLMIPYFPYARQDRVMQSSEAFSLKAIAKLVNSLGYDEVIVCDPHSDVTAALVESVRVVTQAEIIKGFDALQDLAVEHTLCVVAPDAGADKKAWAVPLLAPRVAASKVRNVTTGEITETRLHDPYGAVPHRDCLIVDDICDGGRTFVELAKVLHTAGAKSVSLYVTHGIFSKGLGVFTGLIDAVYTTDTFLSSHTKEQPVPFHVHHIDFGLLCP